MMTPEYQNIYTLNVLMQALSSFPSPSSDTSNSQARAVLSKDEENMKSPVNKILREEFYLRVPRDGRDLLLYSGGMPFVYKETLTGGHVPLPDGGVRPAGDDVGVLHRHTVDVARVAPGEEGGSLLSSLSKLYLYFIYFRTPRHSVSSVLVAHIRAVASSLPVTNMLPSSDKHMQLMLSSWSAIVSSSSPFFPPVDPPAPMVVV